jgi:hypothetical protein
MIYFLSEKDPIGTMAIICTIDFCVKHCAHFITERIWFFWPQPCHMHGVNLHSLTSKGP